MAQTLRRHPAPPHTSGPLTDGYSLRRSLSRHRTRDRLRRYDQGAGGWDAGARPLPSPWSREKRAATWAAGGATGGPACASDHPTRHPRPRSPLARRGHGTDTLSSPHVHAKRAGARETEFWGPKPFPKVGRRGRRTKARFPQCGGSHAGQRPCRPAAGRGACHSSGVASKSPFKLQDCTVTPNSSQPEGSVTHFTLQEMLGFCT